MTHGIGIIAGPADYAMLARVLAAKIARAVASSRPLSLLMIDVDRFKPINDRHGYAIGDKMLRGVALQLKSGIREIDTLGGSAATN